ncbi:UbiA family prenyltransferase [Nocardia sp. NPDC003482]
MSEVSSATFGSNIRRQSVRDKLTGFLRLSKIAVFQHYFGWILAWLSLDPIVARRPTVVLAMMWFLVGSIAIVATTCAIDDIVGFRNGSDAINYRAEETRRDIRRKPLLSGTVSERQAIIFVICAAAIAIFAGVIAFWSLGWQSPNFAYLMYLAGFILSIQYSAGLRMSYHLGGAEMLLFGATACGLYAPFLAVAGHWTRSVAAEGVLLGLWMLMVSSYSNVNDIVGDRMVGRKTLATVSNSASLAAVLSLLVTGSIAATVWLVVGAGFPWWTFLTMVPPTFLHVRQLHLGPVRKQWLDARRMGMYAYNLGFLGIAIPATYLFAAT